MSDSTYGNLKPFPEMKLAAEKAWHGFPETRGVRFPKLYIKKVAGRWCLFVWKLVDSADRPQLVVIKSFPGQRELNLFIRGYP